LAFTTHHEFSGHTVGYPIPFHMDICHATQTTGTVFDATAVLI
jgi:hypothetical protein